MEFVIFHLVYLQSMVKLFIMLSIAYQQDIKHVFNDASYNNESLDHKNSVY